MLPQGERQGRRTGEDLARPSALQQLLRWQRRSWGIQRLPRAPHDSGDERRQLRAPELAPCSERGSCVQPPTPLIWMGLASMLGSPLLMMVSLAAVQAISVP